MRRKDDTLRDTLLEHARSLADAQGLDAVNIRSIAKKAGVATGTVYNYFSNKDEILLALTETYWRKTLAEMRTAVTAGSFCQKLEEVFAFLRERIDRDAGRLMESLSHVEITGQQRMRSMQANLEADLIRLLDQDPEVRINIWDETFSKEQFARFIMLNMMMLLKTKAPDIDFFIAMIRRTIY